MDQWENPSSTHVSPELQIKASLNRTLGRVQSLLSLDSQLTKVTEMETLTETGVAPHCHFTANSYYAKPNPSPYYINSNNSLSPKPYSDYPGYKSGSEKESRLSGQPGSIPEYKLSKEMDVDGQRVQNSGNPFPQYYSQSVQQMSSSFISSYHGNLHKEIGEKRTSKGLTDFSDKQPKNGQDLSDNKGGHSPQTGHAYIREEGELYSGERNHKLMHAKQMYMSHQPVIEGHRQAYSSYPNWRNNTVPSGDIYSLHKDTKQTSSDQQVCAINNEDMIISNKMKSTEQAGSDPRHASNPKSTFDGSQKKHENSTSNQDGQDPKLEPCYSPSNFRSKDTVMSIKGREMQQDSDIIKNEVYRSRLFYRHDYVSHEFQGKEKMSPVAYDRNIRPPYQWNDHASRHPLQEFQDSLQSPTKVRPNYPYSSTPGKNSNECTSLRPEWKNVPLQMLKAFPTDKCGLSDANQDFEVDVIPTRSSSSTHTSSSNPKEATDRRSPSPIKSAYTPNTRMSYNAMVSPFTGSDHYHSRKSSGEQESTSDNKDPLSYHDDSLLSKKEALSDDGCEESPYPGTRPDLSLSPPSPDSSMTYPPHFPHPYFASPIRGPPPVQRLQFGSPRGQHDTPQISRPNFPFDKDFTGQFPLPGMAPEMAMGGGYMGPLPPNVIQGVGEDKDIFFCHLCSYSGKSKLEFDTHMNIHFEYNCPHCDYTSRTEGRLKRHIKDFHSDDSSRRALPGRPKVYKCKQCPFSSKEKDKFWDHARTHIKEDKLLQCPKCAFVTEYKHHLEYHLRNHFNSKPYKCNKCNYSCVNKSMLNSHMKSHTNVYQYRCSNCTYATKYCHSLKLHLRKYNHKPATVLNQDGSIPQGLDVESSGIAVVAKRGPPRGPRGMKKGKQERYGGQMFGMPPAQLGMNQMMNGIMPFWPMLSHMGGMGHLSPSSGMLPGIGNLANQLKMHSGDGDHRRMSDSDKMDIIDNSSDDESGHLRDDEFACRLCDFIGDNTEALCVHFVQVHKDEAREVARACGVSEENLAASLSRLIPEMMAGRRLSEPLTESDSEPSDYTPGNSTSGMAPQSPDAMQNEQKTPESKISPPGWQALHPPEHREVLSYSQMLTSSTEHDDSMGETDILQQMTLKFGDSNMLPEKPANVPEEQRLPKETPLDLTKPKSVSPKEMTSPTSSSGTDLCQATVLETDTPISQPFKKRMIREDEEESYGHDMTAQVPRKRARKGKAYKLDTLCMKLQERQINHAEDAEEIQSDSEIHMDKFKLSDSGTEVKIDNPEISSEKLDGRETTLTSFKASEGSFPSTSHQSEEDEETDEYEMNDGECDGERRKKFNVDEVKIMKSPDRSVETKNIEVNSSTEVDSEFEKLQRSLAILNSGIDPEIECKSTESLSTSTITSCDVDGTLPDDSDKMFPSNKLEASMSTCGADQKIQTIDKIEQNCESEKNNSDTNFCVQEEHVLLNSDKEINGGSRSSNSIEKTSSSNITSNKDIQSNLSITNYAEVVFPTAVSTFSGKDEPQLKDADFSFHSIQTGMEREPKIESSLHDVNDDEHKTKDADGSRDKITEATQETVDPVEMINTVIENRKKPVPPAVRRGTELAWKLLHDTVNPVTSLPLPIDSPPLPQTQISATAVTCSHSVNTSSSVSVRTNIGLKQPLHFSPRAYPSQRPVHPMSPHMHMPLPPTPMAFIPPTSHMMPEPAPMVRPLAPPPMKMVKPEEYSCTYCGLSFQDCVMYTVHMGYHSNRNPFKCNSCGIVCRDKVDFFLHIARSPHA